VCPFNAMLYIFLFFIFFNFFFHFIFLVVHTSEVLIFCRKMLIQQHVFIVSNTKALLASFFPLSTLGSICLFHFRKKDRCSQDTRWDRVVGILGLYLTLLVHHRPKLCITGTQKCMSEQHQDVFGQHQIHLVQVVGNRGKKKQSTTFVLPAILYIKVTCLSVSGQFPGTARTFVSGQFPGTARTFVCLFVCLFVFFFFLGFCFLCQLNCPDLLLFFFFGFCFLCQLNCPDLFFLFFFFFWGFVFCVS
jgi:hypothetical protein